MSAATWQSHRRVDGKRQRRSRRGSHARDPSHRSGADRSGARPAYARCRGRGDRVRSAGSTAASALSRSCRRTACSAAISYAGFSPMQAMTMTEHRGGGERHERRAIHRLPARRSGIRPADRGRRRNRARCRTRSRACRRRLRSSTASINLRGTVLPIVDLRRRFDLVSSETASGRRILVVGGRRRADGFIVDAVSEVLKVTRRCNSAGAGTVAGANAPDRPCREPEGTVADHSAHRSRATSHRRRSERRCRVRLRPISTPASTDS